MLKLYKKQLGLLFFISILSFNFNSANAQGCAFNLNYQYPLATFSPICNGIAAEVANDNWGGEYFLMNVTSGNTYLVSTCGGGWDSQLTIYNETTQALIGYSDDACGFQSEVTFVAGFTGVARVLINEWNCIANSDNITTNVTCTATALPPPVNDNCSSVVASALTSPGSLTFTGTSAGSTDDSFGGSLGNAQVWHAFTITECANVTINTLGTSPSFSTMFTGISTACPVNFPSTWITSNSYDFTTSGDGNITAIFYNLAPGTYYVPVIGTAPNNHAYTLNISAVDFITQPVITPAGPTTFCAGGSVQLDVTQQLLPIDISVTVSGTGFLDEVSWTLTNSLGSVIASGGDYATGSTNTVTAGGTNGPFSFNLETQGTFSDNITDYSLTCLSSGALLASGTLNGGLTTTVPSLACSSLATYTWSPATGLNVTNGASVVAAPAISTTYTVSASSPSLSCTKTQTIDVIVNSAPIATITAGGATTFCAGGSVVLNAPTGAGLTYVWNNNGIAISPAATAQTYTATAAGSYTVTVTASGCSATSAATIVNVETGLDYVNTQFPISATICENEGLTIYGQVYEPGLTDPNTQAAGVAVEYGVFTSDSDPATWPSSAWSTATYNPLSTVNPNNDEYSGTLTGLTAGTYYYAFRYSLNGCGFQYGGISATGGGIWDGTTNINGVLTVNALPTATISAGTTSFCTGGNVVLSAPSGVGLTYVWNNNGVAISPAATAQTYTATAAGSYTVTVTESGCSATSAATIVTVNALPTATITAGVTTFCTGGSVILNAPIVTGLTYVWNNNGTAILPAATAQTYTATAAGLYTVQVTDANGCSATSAPTAVTVNPIPVINLGTQTNPSSCSINDGSIEVTGSGTGTLSWTGAASSSSSVSAFPATISSLGSGTYNITFTSTAGCSSTILNVTLTAPSSPTATISAGTTSFCTGGNVVLSAPTGAGLTYVWNNNGVAISPAATAQTYTATAAGSYTVTVTESGCSATSAATIVTVNALPTATITAGVTTFCTGGSVILNAPIVTGLTYVWNNNGTAILPAATAQTYTATAAGLYTVQVTDANGCSATSAPTAVTVNPIPVINLGTQTNPSSCSINDGSIEVTGSGTGTLSWTGAASSSSSVSAFPATISSLGSGTYNITFTSTAGCSSTILNVTLTAPSSPTATISAGTTSFCTGGNVVLSAPTGAGLTYVWNNNGVAISPAATAQTYTATAAGSYTVTVTESGCSATSAATIVTVNALPTATITAGVTTFCTGESVILNAPIVTGLTYVWNNNGTAILPAATAQTYTATAAGLYTVQVTDANGCSATSAPTAVTVNPIPVINLGTQTNPSSCSINDGSIEVTGSGTGTLSWTGAASSSSSVSAFPATISSLGSGTYNITFTSTAGCSSTILNVTLTAPSSPTATISAGTTSFCTGGNVVLSAPTGAGLTYVWNNNGVAISPAATAQTYTATAAGSYTVTVTESGCSATSAATIVTVNALPTATITAGGTTTLCIGGNVLLNAPVVTGLTYVWNNNGTAILPAATAQTYTATAAGLYTVQVTDANGCSATSAPTAVTVNPIPVINLGTQTNPSSCSINDGSIEVTGSGTGTLSWTGAASSSSSVSAFPATISSLGSGTYNITFTSTAGCSSTILNVTLTAPSSPTATISAGTTSFCTGGNVVLSAPTGAGLTYVWNNNGVAISPAATAPTYTATTAGSYTVTVNQGGCSATSPATIVTVNALPSATITAAGSTTFCTVGNVVLSAPTGAGLTYVWSNNGTAILPAATAQNYTATAAGSYTVQVTDASGCSAISVPLTVTINTPTTPAFTQLGAYCLNAIPAILPTTSLNGITGTWNSAISTAAIGTTTYTFTPTAGLCATPATMIIAVNFNTLPTFTQVSPICLGGTFTLPNLSSNGISGLWSPPINNLSTTTYTFTPTTGQCAVNNTMSVTVTPNVTPTFTQVAAICAGTTLSALPLISNNGISGTWSPAINNAATTTYTFTPTAGICANTASMTITVNPTTIPTFTAIAPICSGGTFSLSAISNNGVFGSWTPAFDNTVTSTYTFTPLAIPGVCAATTTMTITVNPSVTPTFTQVSPICAGATLAALPLTSNNGVAGSWSPALNNAATTTYTFTPTSGLCATTTTMTIVVNPNVAPNFAQIPPICSGGSFSLPPICPIGISGTWIPAVNNLATTTYLFTPSAGQCATIATMTVVVNPNVTPTFTQVGPVCFGASFTLPTPSNNGISGSWAPAPNNTSTSSYLFTPTAGQCATTAFMGVTVLPNVIPTFNPIAPICAGSSLTLPAISTNGIAGTWFPAVNNAATTTYTFTPTAGQCAVTATLTVTVTPSVTPTFTAVAAICAGATLAPLPTTSNNGIAGSWSSPLDNTVTATYTFTPNVGICATTQTLTITVNPNVTPNFVQVAPICAGGSLTALPSTSPNGVTGNWFGPLDNTVTTTYTFTPTIGLCATNASMTIVVNPIVTPTFNPIAAICEGASLILPISSIELITGTWSPAVNNTATTTYTFTPDAGQCAVTTTLTVNVIPNVVPLFTPVAAICAGATLAPLPSPSTNGFAGTWLPALDNTVTTTYTFTPNAGVCATTQTLTITVNPNVAPNFVQVAPICVGGALAALPLISPNGITGSWSPAMDNTVTTTYNFTPDAGQCATAATMTITVNPIVTPSFTAVGPICSGASLVLPTSSVEGIIGTWSPAVNNLATTPYTFTPNAGQCGLTANLIVTVTPNVPTVFTQVSPICSGASLILPTSSDNGITGTWSPAPNNLATTTYTFTPTAGVCGTSETMTVTVTPNVTPGFAAVAAICIGETLAALPSTSLNGITGTWSPALDDTQTTMYTFTPNTGICATTQTLTITVNQLTIPAFVPVTPICIGSLISALPTLSTNGISGTWSPALDNTQTMTYTFTPNTGQCADISTMTITVNPLTPTTFAAVAPICAGSVLGALPLISNEGITGTWTPALDNTQTTTYTFTPDASQCADVSTLTIIVNAPTLPTFVAVGPICQGNTYTLLAGSLEGINGVWSPAIDNTQTMTYTFTPYAGQCASITTMTVALVSASDADFTISSYCNGVGAAPIVTGLPGGVFSFNPPVSDGAVIDATTGLISNGVAATTYIVQYTLTGTCTVFSQELVSFVNTPAIPVLSNDTTYCLTSTFVSMTATNSGGTTNWYSDITMTNLLGTGVNLLPSNTLGASTYYVSENLQGCLSPIDSVLVTVNDCYQFTTTSAFTPDGDGINDTWLIAELSTRYPNNNVTIFNRWGQVLYNSDGYLIPWDGRFDNKDLPVGSYYYIIDFNDALDTPNATGIVTIIRN